MNAPSTSLPNLLRRWPEVVPRIRSARRLVVFLDFDGTLVPIASRPNQINVPPGARRALSQLSRMAKLDIAVISGRSTSDLRHYLKSPGLLLFGFYGAGFGRPLKLSDRERRDLESSWHSLKNIQNCWPRAWLEPKKFSLSIHVQSLPFGQREGLRQWLRRILFPYRKTLCLFENIRDMEVIPSSFGDKGKNVRRFLARHSNGSALPLFFGDDYSDEPAFTAVRRGLSVLVGKNRPTNAQYHLRNPAEVALTLTRLQEELS